MAILYRRDISLLGGGINAIKKRRSGIILDVYDSEIYLDDFKKEIPCIATFYKFFGAYKVDLINDRDLEKKVYDYYLDFLKDRPKLLFEYMARNLIKNISTIAMVVCLIHSILERFNIRFIFIFILLYFVRLLISLV